VTPRGETAAPPSALDALIAPEIRDDALYRWILRIAATPGVRHILEIGSSSGSGSTEAFVAGALRNPDRPTVHCVEVSRARFAALVERWSGQDLVCCHNVSTVPVEAFPSPEEVDAFRRRVWTRFRFIARAKVMAWLRQDLAYLRREGLSGWGIREIRAGHGIDRFDAVLIDGSEFTGPADLGEVYGAGYVILDDVRTFKNHDNARRLARDPAYRLLTRSRRPRNGFAVFARRDLATPEEVAS
jgi:hypothetical protein